ncbi:hypothetical protein RYX36_006108 [Vicia faba]
MISVVAISSSKFDAIKGHGREHGDGIDWVGSGTWGGWGGPREERGEGQEERSEGGENEEPGEGNRERYEGERGDMEYGDPNEEP